MAAAEIISIIKDVATGTAAIVGACVAVAGLKAWKRQLRGKTDYELARRVLRAAYRVRDEIRAVRDPLITATETESAHQEFYKGEARNPLTSPDAVVLEMRWRKLTDKLSELHAESLEAEVSWGNAIQDSLKPLMSAIKNLALAIRRLSRDRLSIGKEERASLEAIMWRFDDSGEDTFRDEVNKAISHIEGFLKPHLKL